jgi:hypothetical protein
VDHPIVQEVLATHRSLGDWDWLRRFRIALETGVKKPIAKADFWIIFHARPLLVERMKLTDIQRTLRSLLRQPAEPMLGLNCGERQKLLARLTQTRQGFHNLLRRLALLD